MREIVVDTETTGLDPADGHRVIEIGCVELFDHVPTGNTFHHYLYPERLIPPEAAKARARIDRRVSGWKASVSQRLPRKCSISSATLRS